jgi:protein-tyrosine phosphatase
MRYAITFTVLAAVLLVEAAIEGGWAWLLVWPAVSFLVVAIAYAGAGPSLLGKRPAGTIAAWALVLHLPFFALTWGLWHIHRRLVRREPAHEIVPGMWIGRRPLPRELPSAVTLIVDLTCEFRELVGVRTSRTYICLPTLDSMAPRPVDLCRAVDVVAKWEGPVFIHCAAGHGRTGMFAASVLVARGLASDVAAAIKMLRAVRPGIRLNPAQRQRVEALVATTDP